MAFRTVGAAILQTMVTVDAGGTATSQGYQVIDHHNGLEICREMERKFHRAPIPHKERTYVEKMVIGGVTISSVTTETGRTVTRESSCTELKKD